ncbi:PrgI family protein [Streptococcus gallolyticus]|uniref:PrgI family protein n=1 Tax=Streptococcus gallolyticus TaxID=315405 RepID=A0A1H7XX00_9STRE|nr:PrgI family protein [Streptococcus gallolyticus]SEF25569.1 PrgI family protein [Streptococcus gallolyticus]SEM38124.1 PrgI family protein [Streptococcus gallolyticus]
MNKLGSEFLKEFDNYERPVLFGATFRQVVLILGVVIGVGIAFAILSLGQSKNVMLITGVILALPVAFPFILYGIKKDEDLKEYVMFKLKVQKRSYQTDFQKGDDFTKDDFKNWKKIKEINEG